MAERTLLLLRHAKSSWDDPLLDDFDRPLGKRGLRAAPRMAQAMAERGLFPNAAIVSSALRTRQTWDLSSEAIGGDKISVRFDNSIYEAPPEAILAAIRATDDSIKTLLVVGHNPGLEALCLRLASPDSDGAAVARIREKFPTGALAQFVVCGSWNTLAAARLATFLRPRDLD